MHSKATVAGFIASGLLAAVALGACSNNNSAPPASTSTSASTTTSSASSAAACSKALITTAAKSSSSVGSVSAVNGFGCSGSWAYADVTVGSGNASFDAVIVLEAQGSTWSVADRGNACNNHLVPAAIYTQACTTS
jgi:hypothetical protein